MEEEEEEAKKETDGEADCCVKWQNAFNQLQRAQRGEKKKKKGNRAKKYRSLRRPFTTSDKLSS